jgi:type IV pilus assembly protein PilX
MRHHKTIIPRQQGTALVIALVMLLVITVAGVTSMRSSALQERMSGNTRDREVAFQAAEGALRAGESYLNGFTSTPSPAVDYFHGDGDGPDPIEADCTDQGFHQVTVHDEADGDACYFVEETTIAGSGITKPGSPVQTQVLYQVVARGVGLTDRAQVVLRSSYRW